MAGVASVRATHASPLRNMHAKGDAVHAGCRFRHCIIWGEIHKLGLGAGPSAARARGGDLPYSAQHRDLQRSPRRAREPRRLVAVMAADIAGYSRLMGVDEDGTLRALNS